MTKKSNEYDKFENMTRQLLAVPHAELKAKLDAEKKARKNKTKKGKDK